MNVGLRRLRAAAARRAQQHYCYHPSRSLQFTSSLSSKYSATLPPNPLHGWMPTPFITEQEAGGQWFSADLFSRLLKERIVMLSGAIEERTSAQIVASLLYLEADNPERPISLYIDSPGGSVQSGLSIYDTLQYVQCDVSTICLGQAASMGSLLLAAGAKGRRYALPHSSIMIHQPSGGYHGQASDIAIHAKEILRIRNELNKIYQRHLTGKRAEAMGLEEIEKLMERDHFMSAEEALELGLIDEILTSRKKFPLEDKKNSGGKE